MSDRSKLINDTKSFPDSQVVTFEGQKTTLGELRKGAGGSVHGQCPKCKSASVVNVKGVNVCNKCGFDRWL